MTVFHNSFSVIEKTNKPKNIIFGATNQLFLKSIFSMDCVLRLDNFQMKSPSSEKPEIFVCSSKIFIKYPVEFKNYIIEGTSDESNAINIKIIRQKMLILTLDFLEPIQAYFQNQYNVK